MKGIEPSFFGGLSTVSIGSLRSKASSPGTFTVKVKLGSTIIATTGGFSLEAALSDVITNIEFLMMCRCTGVSGTIRVIGTLEHLEAAGIYRKASCSLRAAARPPTPQLQPCLTSPPRFR